MSNPSTHPVILSPPDPTMPFTPEQRYKFDYEIWKRTGEYKSSIPNLNGLQASVAELNTLVGVNVSLSVQNQIDLKEDKTALKTMAYQDANNVNITGGQLSGTNIESNTIRRNIMSIEAGNSGIDIFMGGSLASNTTEIGNTAGVETILISYSMQANTLDVPGNYIEVMAWGTVAANGNNKRIKLKLGSTTLLDTGLIAANSGSWCIISDIIRVSATSQQAISRIISSNSLIVDSASYLLSSENLTTLLNVFCTGEGVAANDVIQKGLIIKWFT